MSWQAQAQADLEHQQVLRNHTRRLALRRPPAVVAKGAFSGNGLRKLERIHRSLLQISSYPAEQQVDAVSAMFDWIRKSTRRGWTISQQKLLLGAWRHALDLASADAEPNVAVEAYAEWIRCVRIEAKALTAIRDLAKEEGES